MCRAWAATACQAASALRIPLAPPVTGPSLRPRVSVSRVGLTRSHRSQSVGLSQSVSVTWSHLANPPRPPGHRPQPAPPDLSQSSRSHPVSPGLSQTVSTRCHLANPPRPPGHRPQPAPRVSISRSRAHPSHPVSVSRAQPGLDTAPGLSQSGLYPVSVSRAQPGLSHPVSVSRGSTTGPGPHPVSPLVNTFDQCMRHPLSPPRCVLTSQGTCTRAHTHTFDHTRSFDHTRTRIFDHT